jgi:chromosome segregation ATPase
MKQKLDKVLNKLYMPGQDQIIGGMTSNGLPHNVIRGSTQNAEINTPLKNDDEGEDHEATYNNGVGGAQEIEWANELRKADERSHEVRLRCEDLKKQNQDLESKLRVLEESLETRDVEILRLGSLYQGGQNNEKLAMQYSQDLNKKIVQKLNNQIDFVNKENHRLQTQLDLFIKDKSIIDHIDKYKADIDELSFENSTLRKDLRELTVRLKDY